MPPRDQLQTVAELVRQHAAPETASWFAAGVHSFLSGQEKTLCKALGCRAAGQCAPTTEAAFRRRNRHLQNAYILVECPPEASTLDRCRTLAHALERFEATSWRWSKDHAEPPARLDALQAELWHALKTGAPTVTSARHLQRLVLPA